MNFFGFAYSQIDMAPLLTVQSGTLNTHITAAASAD